MASQPEMQITAQMLYDRILRSSNYFLHNCKGFSVEILQMEDPSYAEIAELMRRLSRVVVALADDFDPMMGQKAFEYCELMCSIGVAIQNSDQIALERSLVELERRPGV